MNYNDTYNMKIDSLQSLLNEAEADETLTKLSADEGVKAPEGSEEREPKTEPVEKVEDPTCTNQEGEDIKPIHEEKDDNADKSEKKEKIKKALKIAGRVLGGAAIGAAAGTLVGNEIADQKANTAEFMDNKDVADKKLETATAEKDTAQAEFDKAMEDGSLTKDELSTYDNKNAADTKYDNAKQESDKYNDEKLEQQKTEDKNIEKNKRIGKVTGAVLGGVAGAGVGVAYDAHKRKKKENQNSSLDVNNYFNGNSLTEEDEVKIPEGTLERKPEEETVKDITLDKDINVASAEDVKPVENVDKGEEISLEKALKEEDEVKIPEGTEERKPDESEVKDVEDPTCTNQEGEDIKPVENADAVEEEYQYGDYVFSREDLISFAESMIDYIDNFNADELNESFAADKDNDGLLEDLDLFNSLPDDILDEAIDRKKLMAETGKKLDNERDNQELEKHTVDQYKRMDNAFAREAHAYKKQYTGIRGRIKNNFSSFGKTFSDNKKDKELKKQLKHDLKRYKKSGNMDKAEEAQAQLSAAKARISSRRWHRFAATKDNKQEANLKHEQSYNKLYGENGTRRQELEKAKEKMLDKTENVIGQDKPKPSNNPDKPNKPAPSLEVAGNNKQPQTDNTQAKSEQKDMPKVPVKESVEENEVKIPEGTLERKPDESEVKDVDDPTCTNQEGEDVKPVENVDADKKLDEAIEHLNNLILSLNEEDEVKIPEGTEERKPEEETVKDITLDKDINVASAEDVEPVKNGDEAKEVKPEDKEYHAAHAGCADNGCHCDEKEDYHSIKEAIQLGSKRFESEKDKKELVEHVAILLASENKDLMYEEYARLISEAVALKESIVKKYSIIANNRTNSLLEGMNQVETAIANNKSNLFKKLNEQQELNKAISGAKQLSSEEVAFNKEVK